MESLNNDNFVSKIKLDKDQKEKMKQDKQQEIIDKRNDRLQKKMEKEMEKASKVKKNKKENDEENDEENDTTDLGDLQNKSKICKLYKKIVKYKEMFPELSMIKLNRNDSEEKMQNIILECQDILETTWIDSFLIDVFFHTVEQLEPITLRTKYNISGLTVELKKNEKILNLLKQCSMKYGSYAKLSCEYSLLMAICSSTYAVIMANNLKTIGLQNQEAYSKSKESIHTFLNKSTSL